VSSPLALDLTYLWWVDGAGITLLNTLADAGAQLRGVSPYIALLLGRAGRETCPIGSDGRTQGGGPTNAHP
jgi:hypothetical protein